MTLRHLLSFDSAVALVYGVALANWGPRMLQAYGLPVPAPGTSDPDSMLIWNAASFARLAGVALICLGGVLWAVRDVADGKTRKALAVSLFLTNSLAFLIVSAQQVAIWKTTTGMVTVAMFLTFALGYAYLGLMPVRPRETKESMA